MLKKYILAVIFLSLVSIHSRVGQGATTSRDLDKLFDKGECSTLCDKISALVIRPIAPSDIPILSADGNFSVKQGRIIPPQADMVLKEPLFAEGAALMKDYRFGALNPADQKALKIDWADINNKKTPLVAEGGGLDQRDTVLADKADEADERARKLNQRRLELNREISRYNSTCANTPYPPSYCPSWRRSLLTKKAQLEREVAEHNRGIIELRKKIAALKADSSTFRQKVEDWKRLLKRFVEKIKGYYNSIANPGLRKCLTACDADYDSEAAECSKLETPEERSRCYREAMNRYAACRNQCYISFPGPARLILP